MRKTFIAVAVVLLASCAAGAQSGRARGITGKPPAPSPVETKADTANPKKPSLPKEIDGERIYTSRETDERFVILKKPNPRYSKEGQRHRTRGYVFVRAILAADETVKHIEVITGLPDGLSESAIAAARQIRFKPAMKDGKPVSVWVELEYTFQIY